MKKFKSFRPLSSQEAEMARLRYREERRFKKKLKNKDWERHGECNRCGKCCNRAIMDPVEYQQQDTQIYVESIIKGVNGGSGVHLDPMCSYCERDPSDPEKWICRVFNVEKTRPRWCEKFPSCPDDLKNIEGCSYTFTRRKK